MAFLWSISYLRSKHWNPFPFWVACYLSMQIFYDYCGCLLMSQILDKVKPYNYIVHTNNAITKTHVKWQEVIWLANRSRQVLWAGFRIENVQSKMANNFNRRLIAKFGMGNDYGLLYRITYRILLVIIFGDLSQLFWLR